jgi:hypothetical protein
MPKAADTNTITIAGRPVTLKRPMQSWAASKLEQTFPQLNALNEAGKSQADAAEALGVSVGSVRTWTDLIGIKWNNLTRRGPSNPTNNA